MSLVLQKAKGRENYYLGAKLSAGFLLHLTPVWCALLRAGEHCKRTGRAHVFQWVDNHDYFYLVDTSGKYCVLHVLNCVVYVLNCVVYVLY